MSDENKVESEVNPSLDNDVNLEDLFGQLDEDVAMTSHREEEKEEASEDKADEKEATEPEATEDEEKSEEVDETSDWEAKFKEYEERMEKRLKDTQTSYHKANQANQKVLEKISNGEELTEEDLRSLVTEDPQSQDGMQKIVSSVNEALPIAKAVVSQVSGRDMEAIEADVEAFNQLATVDPVLVKQLVETPENDRAAFVIKRGQELKEVFDIVQEHGGSVTEAIANSGNISKQKMTKIRKELEAEVKKEYEEKYKDYVVSSKPTPRGTAPEKTKPSKVDTSKIELSDLF